MKLPVTEDSLRPNACFPRKLQHFVQEAIGFYVKNYEASCGPQPCFYE